METPKIYNHDTQPDELKQCPFCGHKPEWHLKGNEVTPSRTVVIKCPHCGVKMEMGAIRWDVETLATKALEKWNTRVKQS